MQEYMQQNWMQVLDADNLLPVLDAASISAFKVFQVPSIILVKQKTMQAYMQPNWMQVLDAEFVCQYCMQHNSLHYQ